MVSTYQSPLRSKAPSASKGRILIACEDGQVAEELVEVLRRANLKSERAMDFTSACKLLKTGKFQVIFTTPGVPGGTWEKLMEFGRGSGKDLSFVVVARSFDLSDWANCLKNGAFEVLDSISEISSAGEVAMNAFLAAKAIAGRKSTRRVVVELPDLSFI
jgi:DNA-binding NtrC family response regulator